MKTYFTAIFLVVFLTGTPALHAEPQRVAIKDPQQKTKERTAKAQIKNIDLRDIEDPAARKAIQEILNYLGLQAQK